MSYYRSVTQQLRREEKEAQRRRDEEARAPRQRSRPVTGPPGSPDHGRFQRSPGRPPRDPEVRRRPPKEIDLQARSEKAAYPIPLRPAFLFLFADQGYTIFPQGEGPGLARRMVERLTDAIEQHGPWTSSDYNQLIQARVIWQARLIGDDVRYTLFGTRRGRLSKIMQLQLDRAKQQRDAVAKLEQIAAAVLRPSREV